MNLQQSVSNICILINPFSAGRLKKVIGEVTKSLGSLNIPYSIYVNNWPDSLLSYSDLWIIGGDGTLNFTINKYKKIEIPVVILKGGTGNDFAWKLYGNFNIKQQIEAGLTSAPKPIDVGQCNNKFYINSAGFGFDGEVLKSMKSIRSVGGHLGYLGIVLKSIFTYKEVHFRIIAKEVYAGKYLLVAINNSSRTGGGFLITPDAQVNDGKLNMLLCKNLPVMKRLRYLPVIEKGKHLQLPFIIYERGEVFTVIADREILGQLDGEMIKGKEFEIKVLPGYMRFRY